MKVTGRRIFAAAAIAALFGGSAWRAAIAQEPARAPTDIQGFRFAVIGDTGTGGSDQYRVGARLTQMRETFPFDVVLMMGDNIYGSDTPRAFARKFELPYAALLKGGAKFYATLGNHDNPNQRFYKNFNMNGNRYYSFKPREGIRFLSLDSNYMDKDQIAWLERELSASDPDWKIPFFHHPLYSSGETHGSSVELRKILEPLFRRYGVSIVLAGHEHFYERSKPQHGITYFTVGSSAKLRRGDIQATNLTAKGFDGDNVFMLCEIKDDELTFQVISKTGELIDSGSVRRNPAKPGTKEKQ